MDQKTFYNSVNPEYLKYEKNIPYAKYLVKKMVMSIGGRREKVMEVGAGQGRFTFELAKNCGQVTASDISDHEIALLNQMIRKNRVKNIKTEVRDLLKRNRTGKREPVDHIVGFFILHHLPREKYNRLVENFAQMVKKGGRMSFIEPNCLYPFHLVEILMRPDMKWEIEKGIYTDYLKRFIRACVARGCEVKKAEVFGFSPPPVINAFPKATVLDRVVERIPLVKHVACPFVLLTAERV